MIPWIGQRLSQDQGEAKTYLKCEMRAVAQVYTLETRGVVVIPNDAAATVTPGARSLTCYGQGHNGVIGDVAALDKADALQLGQLRQPHDRGVGEEGAAAEIDVPDPVT